MVTNAKGKPNGTSGLAATTRHLDQHHLRWHLIMGGMVNLEPIPARCRVAAPLDGPCFPADPGSEYADQAKIYAARGCYAHCLPGSAGSSERNWLCPGLQSDQAGGKFFVSGNKLLYSATDQIYSIPGISGEPGYSTR